DGHRLRAVAACGPAGISRREDLQPDLPVTPGIAAASQSGGRRAHQELDPGRPGPDPHRPGAAAVAEGPGREGRGPKRRQGQPRPLTYVVARDEPVDIGGYRHAMTVRLPQRQVVDDGPGPS